MEEKKEVSKESQEILENYNSDRQAGQYQNNKSFIDDQIILHAGKTENKESVIMIFAKYFPSLSAKKDANCLRRYFVFLLDEIVNSKYIMIYFHSGLSGYSSLQMMYFLLRKLPEKYSANLLKFYIVDPSFLVKSYNFFNLPNVLKQKLEYIKSMKYLNEQPWFKKEHEEKVQPYVKAASKSESKMFSEAPMQQKQQLFGLSLEELELDEDVQIPRAISGFLKYFTTPNSPHVKEPGIFRKAPRDSDIKEMESRIIAKDYLFLATHEDPHVVASIIYLCVPFVKFVREVWENAFLNKVLSAMPEPIIPFKQYDEIKVLSQIQAAEERREHVHQIVESIPEMNFRVLRHIINLLRYIERFSEENLMKMEALTKIFAPTLIRGRPQSDKIQEAIEELMMNPIVVEVIQIMYSDYETIFASILFDGNPNPEFIEAMMIDEIQQSNNQANIVGNAESPEEVVFTRVKSLTVQVDS